MPSTADFSADDLIQRFCEIVMAAEGGRPRNFNVDATISSLLEAQLIGRADGSAEGPFGPTDRGRVAFIELNIAVGRDIITHYLNNHGASGPNLLQAALESHRRRAGEYPIGMTPPL